MTTSTTPTGHVGQTLRVAGLAFLGFAAFTSCEFEPMPPDHLSHVMSDPNWRALERSLGESAAAQARAQILGALEMLTGSPEAPRYAWTEEMIDEEIGDPNAAGDEDYGELSLELIELIAEENVARRFKMQLALIEENRFDEVPEPLYAEDLWSKWQELLPGLLEDPDALQWDDDPEGPTRKEWAIELFTWNYPTLRESAEMYRVHCMHCHGVSGGGDGPTGQYLMPPPRDYRLGVIKWGKVENGARPRRADILHVLQYGAPRTAMPSFDRFSRGQLEGLIDYVRLLAIRGEVEKLLTMDYIENEYFLPQGAAEEYYEFVWSKWLEADDRYTYYDGEIPRPDEMTPERIANGQALFQGELAACSTCHSDIGDGNGDANFQDLADDDGNTQRRRALDNWGKEYVRALGTDLIPEDLNERFGSRPRNLMLGNYRGGGRPVDLYRKIRHGINGTAMPAANAELTDDQVWDLVYYVLSIAEAHDPARIQERKAHEANHADEEGDSHDGEEGN